MPDREQAIAEIQHAKLNLISARDLLTPITDFLNLGLIDPVGAYNYIRLAIDECTFAIEGLEQAPGAPELQFEPASYTFEYPAAAAGLTVTNSGSGTLSGTVTVQAVGGGPAPSWLTVQPQTFSLSQAASSAHTMNMDWDQFPAGQTLYAEVSITSNAGNGTVSITAHRPAEPPPGGDPALAVQPTELVIAHPTQSTEFEIFNSGDQSKLIAWDVSEVSPYSWMTQDPTSGTVTSEHDTVTVIPDWETWPTNQGLVSRQGTLEVVGTYQGNPVQGSPVLVSVSATRNTGTVGLPPNCVEVSGHPGSYICIDDPSDNWRACGSGAWEGWCVRFDNRHPTTATGNKGMRCSGGAMARVDRYIPETNDCVMSCDLRFPQSWIDCINLGGQHLTGFGACPIRDVNAACIRAELHAMRDAGGGGGYCFAQGFEIQTWARLQGGQTHSLGTRPRVGTVFVANTWYHIEYGVSYNPTDGKISGYIQYPGQRVNWSVNQTPGNTAKLGRYVVWGNVDGRSNPDTGDYVEIRNLTYRIGGRSLPL